MTFRFTMTVEKAAVGRVRRGGKEPDRTRGDQAEWVEGPMRWRMRTRRGDRLSS
jgi:hypothetical protein